MARVGLLPAAGAGRRLGLDSPKELLAVGGRPVIDLSVDHLVEAGVDRLVVVVRPGKEAIAEHLDRRGLPVAVDYVDQRGPIGRLIDALHAAVGLLGDDEVLLLFPDTVIRPNPFLDRAGSTRSSAPSLAEHLDIVLFCHEAPLDWTNFGVIDELTHRVVEKPTSFVGSLCWGAAWWAPSFTEILVGCDDLTDAINLARWTHRRTIDHYRDVGLGRRHTPPSSSGNQG